MVATTHMEISSGVIPGAVMAKIYIKGDGTCIAFLLCEVCASPELRLEMPLGTNDAGGPLHSPPTGCLKSIQKGLLRKEIYRVHLIRAQAFAFPETEETPESCLCAGDSRGLPP